MPKKAKGLSAIEVKRLVAPGFYAVGGVPGLHLRVNEGEGRSWILRPVVKDARRDIGQGSKEEVEGGDSQKKPDPGHMPPAHRDQRLLKVPAASRLWVIGSAPEKFPEIPARTADLWAN